MMTYPTLQLSCFLPALRLAPSRSSRATASFVDITGLLQQAARISYRSHKLHKSTVSPVGWFPTHRCMTTVVVMNGYMAHGEYVGYTESGGT